VITSTPLPLVQRVGSNGLRLSVLKLAPKNKAFATLVMHRRLRDSAHALLQVATVLSRHSHVPIPELRGHGQSNVIDAYGVFDFVLDLREAITALAGERRVPWRHSLGGHIVSKYATNFPNRVEVVAIIEGLGPPHRANQRDKGAKMYELQLIILKRPRLQLQRSRPIQNEAETAERLLRKNRRPDPAQAKDLVPHLLEPTVNGLGWALNSRASSVFVGASRDNDTKFWRNIHTPCC